MKIDEVVLICELGSGSEIEVGRIRRAQGGYSLKYSESWMDFEGRFGVSVLLPVRKEPYFSKSLFRVFADRMPDRDTPTFNDLAERWDVVGVECPLTLLCTVGHRGPSSIVHYPVGQLPGKWSELQDHSIDEGDVLRHIFGD